MYLPPIYLLLHIVFLSFALHSFSITKLCSLPPYLLSIINFAILDFSKELQLGFFPFEWLHQHILARRLKMASSSCYNSPCAACKFLRRKCLPGCIFAPYFPPEEPQKFANVHKIFGASNVNKLLNEVLPEQREDAVSTLAYEAEARVRDPVYGCVSAITFLQRQVERLEKELDAAKADLMRYTQQETRMGYDHHGGGGGGGYFPYYPSSWNDQNPSGGGGNI